MTQNILLQRLEGVAALSVAIALYATVGASWWMFALLLFVPDVSMIGYWFGNQRGQMVYNIVHTYALPLLTALLGYSFGQPMVLSISLIWLAHIGMDRTLGYGLKEAQGFKFTHLGNL